MKDKEFELEVEKFMIPFLEKALTDSLNIIDETLKNPLEKERIIELRGILSDIRREYNNNIGISNEIHDKIIEISNKLDIINN